MDLNLPELEKIGCWKDWRNNYRGGYGWRGKIVSNRKIVLHHTVTPRSGNAKKDVDLISRYHIGKGWGGIGYHIIISSEVKNGYAIACYIGDLDSARAHDPNSKGNSWSPKNQGNYYSIGISFIGNHQTDGYMEEQLKTAKLIIEEIIEDVRFPLIKSWEDVIGHGANSYTWCPDGAMGNRLKPLILNVKNEDMDHLWDDFLKWNDAIGEKKLTALEIELIEKGDSKLVNQTDNLSQEHKDFLIRLMEFNDGIPEPVRNTAWLDTIMLRYGGTYLRRSGAR